MAKNVFAGKKLSVYFRMIAIILAAIPLVYTIGRAAMIWEYPWAIGFSLAGIVLQVLLLVLPEKGYTDYLLIAGSAMLSAAFAFFLMGGVLSIADFIANVHFWGDSSQVPAILAYSGMLFGSACLSVVNCYIND